MPQQQQQQGYVEMAMDAYAKIREIAGNQEVLAADHQVVLDEVHQLQDTLGAISEAVSANQAVIAQLIAALGLSAGDGEGGEEGGD